MIRDVIAGAFEVVDPAGRSGQQNAGHGGTPSGGWPLAAATPSPPLPASAVTAPSPKCGK